MRGHNIFLSILFSSFSIDNYARLPNDNCGVFFFLIFPTRNFTIYEYISIYEVFIM